MFLNENSCVFQNFPRDINLTYPPCSASLGVASVMCCTHLNQYCFVSSSSVLVQCHTEPTELTGVGKKWQISGVPSVGRTSVSAPSWTGSPQGQVPGWPCWSEEGRGRGRVSAWWGGWQKCSISCFLTSGETGCTVVCPRFLCVSSGKCPSGSYSNHSTCQCTFHLFFCLQTVLLLGWFCKDLWR